MSTYNEFEDRNLGIEERLVKRYFWFLVEEHNFRYDGYSAGHSDFSSKKVQIRIEPGRKTPYIFISHKGEPDFTRLTLYEVLQHFEGKPLDIDFQAHSLDYNLNFVANVIKKGYVYKISDETDQWWLPLHRSRYDILKKEYGDEGQSDVFLSNYKELYDYLKHKGAI